MGLVGSILNITFLNRVQLKRPSGLLNILVAMILVGIRLVVTAWLSMQFGLEEDLNLIVRFITGMVIGAVLFYFLTSIFSAADNSKRVSRQFQIAEKQLLELRLSADERVRQAQDQLDEETRRAINPQIKKLIKLLDKKSLASKYTQDLAPQIKSFLEFDVRPLSHELRKQAKKISAPNKETTIKKPKLISIPNRFIAAEILRPGVSWSIMSVIYMFVPFLTFGLPGLFFGLILSVIYGYLQANYRALLPKEQPRRRTVAVTQLLVATFGPALVPVLLVSVSGYPPAMTQILAISTFPISFLLNAGLALGASHDFERNKYSLALKKAKKDIERELSLLDQKIWVHRRNWAMLIHGSVQGSLTAAYSRLALSQNPDRNQIKLVKEHLRQAERSMNKPFSDTIDIDKSLAEIVSTWKGVVEIEIKVEVKLMENLRRDSSVAVCVNQIIKETVSNSVKHGQARNIDIEISSKEAGYVDVVSVDDGKGLKAQFKPGMGSEILDEICSSWSLKKITKTGKVKLTARIPAQL